MPTYTDSKAICASPQHRTSTFARRCQRRTSRSRSAVPTHPLSSCRHTLALSFAFPGCLDHCYGSVAVERLGLRCILRFVNTPLSFVQRPARAFPACQSDSLFDIMRDCERCQVICLCRTTCMGLYVMKIFPLCEMASGIRGKCCRLTWTNSSRCLSRASCQVTHASCALLY
eukprot:3804450-Pleurochrysis_carterae.AAC.3